jgi:hypothetical protein
MIELVLSTSLASSFIWALITFIFIFLGVMLSRWWFVAIMEFGGLDQRDDVALMIVLGIITIAYLIAIYIILILQISIRWIP